MSRWLPLSLTFAALLFSALDFAYYYNRLPPRVASHFGAGGQPDGWSTNNELVAVAVVTLCIVIATLALISFMAYYAPPGLMNLPNKDYWLAPEREAETRRAIARWSLWFAAATLWLLALVFHDVLSANLRQPPRLQASGWLIAGYLAFVAILTIGLILRFWQKPRSERACID